jgi:hypothetical protein
MAMKTTSKILTLMLSLFFVANPVFAEQEENTLTIAGRVEIAQGVTQPKFPPSKSSVPPSKPRSAPLTAPLTPVGGKTLSVGETWSLNGGWAFTANSIDAKATPRQVWVTLSRNGVQLDNGVVPEGGVYTYWDPSPSKVVKFKTKVASIFAGATTDMARFTETYVYLGE